VDLQHPANAQKSRDLRYLKKILTNAEIDLIRVAENPDKLLWSFWACKETAYKVIRKLKDGAPFLPRLWFVQLNSDQSADILRAGEVVIPGAKPVFVQLSSTENSMHCIGADNRNDLDKITWGIEPVPRTGAGENMDPSMFGRQCLIRRMADIYSLDFRAMEVKRSKIGSELQPPQLYYENNKAPFDISLSHDGQFVAYAFLPQQC
jgi:phosphopantetheinyl transferase (holo-ACP synthase)